MRILGAVPDLFFWSKVSATAARLGHQAQLVTTRDAVMAGVEAGADLVLVDLDATALDPIGILRSLRRQDGPDRPELVAFASHVHVQRLEEARAAGCRRVLSRGKLAASLPRLLGSLASEGHADRSLRSQRD